MSAKLGAVGNHNDFVGSLQHGLFGRHQQRVVVVQPPFVNSRHAQHGSANVELGKHIVGVRSQGHTCAGIDVATHQQQIGVGVGSEQVRHRQRIGDHLQRPPNQQAGQLVGGAAAVQQQGVSVFDN